MFARCFNAYQESPQRDRVLSDWDGDVEEDYDPRKPEYIEAASPAEVERRTNELLTKQIEKLEAHCLITERRRSFSKESGGFAVPSAHEELMDKEWKVALHYRSVIDDWRTQSASSTLAARGFSHRRMWSAPCISCEAARFDDEAQSSSPGPMRLERIVSESLLDTGTEPNLLPSQRPRSSESWSSPFLQQSRNRHHRRHSTQLPAVSRGDLHPDVPDPCGNGASVGLLLPLLTQPLPAAEAEFEPSWEAVQPHATELVEQLVGLPSAVEQEQELEQVQEQQEEQEQHSSPAAEECPALSDAPFGDLPAEATPQACSGEDLSKINTRVKLEFARSASGISTEVDSSQSNTPGSSICTYSDSNSPVTPVTPVLGISSGGLLRVQVKHTVLGAVEKLLLCESECLPISRLSHLRTRSEP